MISYFIGEFVAIITPPYMHVMDIKRLKYVHHHVILVSHTTTSGHNLAKNTISQVGVRISGAGFIIQSPGKSKLENCIKFCWSLDIHFPGNIQ